MKVIFLDFDGVLNSDKYIKSCGHFGVVLDPKRMELLEKIVSATDAVIVLSTSWRSHWDADEGKCDEIGKIINSVFHNYRLEIYDKTDIFSIRREDEIAAWIAENGDIESFVVLDDALLDEIGFLKGRVVRTSFYKNGLEEQDVEKAVEILNLNYLL